MRCLGQERHLGEGEAEDEAEAEAEAEDEDEANCVQIRPIFWPTKVLPSLPRAQLRVQSTT